MAIGGTAAVQGLAYLADREQWSTSTWLVGLLAMLGGAALIAGFLTPLAGALAGFMALGIALSWLPLPALNLFEAILPTLFVVIVAAAVVFLGPGALSLDARLFGRREIVIPRTSRPPRP